MDILSSELRDFLIRLGENPACASEKVEHYMKHILHLLSVDDEQVIVSCYGLFGNSKVPAETLAGERNIDVAELEHAIERNLRKLAVTPEWQMVKQLAFRRGS